MYGGMMPSVPEMGMLGGMGGMPPGMDPMMGGMDPMMMGGMAPPGMDPMMGGMDPMMGGGMGAGMPGMDPMMSMAGIPSMPGMPGMDPMMGGMICPPDEAVASRVHAKRDKMINRIMHKYWWRNVRSDVIEVAGNCLICQKASSGGVKKVDPKNETL